MGTCYTRIADPINEVKLLLLLKYNKYKYYG